jgi:hypothetical protein
VRDAGIFLLLLLLPACGRDPEPAKAAPPTESRTTQEGDAPKVHAIVVREADHLVVIVDVGVRDAKGRQVADTKVDVDAPGPAVKVSPPVRGEDLITFEVRVPAATRSIKVLGSSDGGARWSATIATDLDAR